ncbi:GNAT family N-acetyltransferase [Oceanicaulis sp. LC35]|uniref:GNAT family N-acetyltransferase n=1 Tax=Oceanicaulis sp. LC35 TaxID=3349635 RepID=UPI003F879171
MSDDLTLRVAQVADMPALSALMDLAINRLQDDFLSPEQVKASQAFMGIDTQLVKDGTYFMVMRGDAIAGCGGWSYRATLYGGDHTTDQRDARELDPETEPAKVRAMYTHPDHTRQGVGRMILNACEDAARSQGFKRAEMMATLSGQPLYAACGYAPISEEAAIADGISVPLVRMGKALV